MPHHENPNERYFQQAPTWYLKEPSDHKRQWDDSRKKMVSYSADASKERKARYPLNFGFPPNPHSKVSVNAGPDGTLSMPCKFNHRH